MVDRLYSTEEAGKMLGGLCANDVRALIRKGKLRSVGQVVRGTGTKPRKFVRESDLQAYIDALATDSPAVDAAPQAKRRARGREGIARELDRATKYY